MIYKKDLNLVQLAAVDLIQDDMRFLYTLVSNREKIMPTYWIELSPYIGIIIDGAEDWIKAYNRSSNNKIDIPLFNDEEEHYYEKMRNSVKIWGYELDELYDLIKSKYLESEDFFGRSCKKIAKLFHLYDTIGVFFIDEKSCGNTLLDACYIPDFNINVQEGERIREMANFAGKYITSFDVDSGYLIKNHNYNNIDYGGFVRLPFGNAFSIKHVLFSCLCSINFVLNGIEDIIDEEVSTKLRMEYICYYYTQNLLNQIREKYGIDFLMSNLYFSKEFRNSLAHYKLGVDLKEFDLFLSDPLKGLTQKFFQTDYYSIKRFVIKELSDTARKIEAYLKFGKNCNAGSKEKA